MVNCCTNSEHQTKADKASDNFFTPGWLVDKISYFYEGKIDLDPCADRLKRIPATKHYRFLDDGLNGVAIFSATPLTLKVRTPV
jgi:hypothetical protein